MSIAPTCSFCHDELTEPGALLFSPPLDAEWTVEKKHLCVKCYGRVRVDDDLDAFVREQAEHDPSFATSFLNRGGLSLLLFWLEAWENGGRYPVEATKQTLDMWRPRPC